MMIGPDTRQTPARLGQQIITLFNSNVSMFPSTIHHPYCPRPSGPRTALLLIITLASCNLNAHIQTFYWTLISQQMLRIIS